MEKDTRTYGIDIEYFSKAESYEPFDMNVKMTLCSDIGATNAIKAFLRLLECAGFGKIDSRILEEIYLERKDEEEALAKYLKN